MKNAMRNITNLGIASKTHFQWTRFPVNTPSLHKWFSSEQGCCNRLALTARQPDQQNWKYCGVEFRSRNIRWFDILLPQSESDKQHKQNCRTLTKVLYQKATI